MLDRAAKGINYFNITKKRSSYGVAFLICPTNPIMTVVFGQGSGRRGGDVKGNIHIFIILYLNTQFLILGVNTILLKARKDYKYSIT